MFCARKGAPDFVVWSPYGAMHQGSLKGSRIGLCNFLVFRINIYIVSPTNNKKNVSTDIRCFTIKKLGEVLKDQDSLSSFNSFAGRQGFVRLPHLKGSCCLDNENARLLFSLYKLNATFHIFQDI